MYRFANPSAFEWLWLIPLVWFSAWASQKKLSSQLTSSFGKKLTPFLTSSKSTGRRRLRLILFSFALLCFVIALARPQAGRGQQAIKSEGIELMIAVDVSNSMLAEDIKPSRLAFAKSEIIRLLDLLSGDKVGLIAFAGSATLVSPLTTDKAALKMFVESLSPISVENQGTDFRKAIAEAKEAFERGGVDPDEGVTVTRVVLIASDGEDQEKGAIDEAKKAAMSGIRIFAIAFGTERGGPIPIRDERGFLRGYKKDSSGQEVVTQVKGTALRELASAGKGSFFHIAFGANDAHTVRAELDKLEKAQFATDMTTSYDEKYQYFIVLGLLFILLELVIGDRQSAGRIWRGRFEVAAK